MKLTTIKEDVMLSVLSEQIKKFFFKAMVEGWVANSEKMTISQLPGFKAVEFQDGDFRLLDCWCETPNYFSSGNTTIWKKDIPVWTMNYRGSYPPWPEVVSFLKDVLLKAYKDQEFYGGRGPLSVCGRELMYINILQRNDFDRFSGHEMIFNTKTGQSYGFHEYQGMCLF
jgi:hypothetical protein